MPEALLRSRIVQRWIGPAVLLALTACGPATRYIPGNLELLITNLGTPDAQVRLRGGDDHACLTVGSSVKATADGHVLPLLSRGGSASGWLSGEGPLCEPATWQLPLDLADGAASTEVTITDATTLADAMFLHLWQPRTYVLTQPASGGVRGGDTIVLMRSPDTDVVDSVSVILQPEAPSSPVEIRSNALTVTGGSVALVLPRDLPLGPATLQLMMDRARAGTTTCSLEIGCHAWVFTAKDQQLVRVVVTQ